MKKRWIVLIVIGVVLIRITTWNLFVLFCMPPEINSHVIDGRCVQTQTKHYLFSIYEVHHFVDGVYEKKQVTFSLGSRDFVWLYDENGQFIEYFSYS